jgi:NTP pyrophosphatase (non-canonical NTP hydrolase)
MLILDYADFVAKSDDTRGRVDEDRERKGQYGIAAEIGSLVAAVKKKELFTALPWNRPNDEIVEELGDILWYAAMLAGLANGSSILEPIKRNLASLPTRIEDAPDFKASLPGDDYKQFLIKSSKFLASPRGRTFDDYQKIAFLTARTKGEELHHVCLTRLLLYATVMMSHGFPQVEKHLQDDIVRIERDDALGMVMWHLAALATLYGISLDDVISQNRTKLNELHNFDQALPTPLYDDCDAVPLDQRLPREFEVAFVSISEGKLQMYYEGRPLGDELTDNSREDDGYRFHDVMHLANAAKLGWSPVLRKLLGLKRKFNRELDEVEDGARAVFVEEAVVKAIHSEGQEAGAAITKYDSSQPSQLFTDRGQITFSFLKLMRRFVRGLEVEKSKYWEWQDAIIDAHLIYARLQQEKQGTIRVSLVKRSITFNADVYVNFPGAIAGTGAATVALNAGDLDILTDGEKKRAGGEPALLALVTAQKRAALSAIGVNPADAQLAAQLDITSLGDGCLGFRARSDVQRAIWKKKIISFRSIDLVSDCSAFCQVFGLADVRAQKNN